jgi:mycofactocin system glycosyltransferase
MVDLVEQAGAGGRRPPPPGAIAVAPRTPELPAGTELVADGDLVVLAAGRRLLGGSPTRLLRLGPRAGATTQRWLGGEPVSADPAERRLARRLVSAGLLHPTADRAARAETPGVTVVVPVCDRPASLARLLDALAGVGCVVVDDGSRDAAATERAARAGGARYLALEDNVGPAAARNAGLAVVDTPYVAFVDSDCVPGPGWLGPLLAHFDDPLVGAAAPRVMAADGPGWLARYEAARSPLDMGSRPALVRPRTRVAYVPTAALVVRRALVSGACFDESLRGGEDVDFVWRTVASGWDVRYEPASTVAHHAERGAREWAVRRAFYGATAGPLSLRHPDDIAAVSLPGWMALAGGLLLARRPVPAAGVVLGAGGLLARRLRGVLDEPGTTAARLMARALTQGATPVVTSAVRAWSPALAAALWSRRLRRAALGAFGVAALADWLTDRPRLDPARYAVAHAADDLAYGLGLWRGCWRARTVRPLLARVTGGWQQPAGAGRQDDDAGNGAAQAGLPSSSR